MKKRLKWRLSKLPTVEELQSLVKDKIITQDEAREILFTNEEVEVMDDESLKAEIKFLRELVGKLSNNSQTAIIEKIEVIRNPYIQYPWYNPYLIWCSNMSNDTNCQVDSNITPQSSNFSDIKTF